MPLHQPRERQRGSALALTLIVLLLLGGLGLAISATIQTRGRASAESVWNSSAMYVADSGIEFAYSLVWSEFLAANGGEAGSVPEFKSFLSQAPRSMLDGDTWDVTDQMPDFGIPFESATITRQDRSELDLNLIIEVVLNRDGSAFQLSRTYRAAGEAYSGLDFVMFSNNVNCILCHTKIDSVEKFSGDEYPGVKVATLESFMLRTKSANSTIAGSLYVRGDVTDTHGNPLSSLAGTTLKAWDLDTDGMVQLDSSGDKIQVPFSAGDNFFEAGSHTDALEDSGVPEAFPSSFPDGNGNKIVDNDEFQSIAEASTGTLSGGVIQEIADTSSYTGSGMPTSGGTSSVAGATGNNLILVGTDTDPIVIDGRVTVDGDVVIKGKVKGSGSIWARGNVYVVGDLTYADGTNSNGDRTYGKADDGTVNALGLTAGGNILIGDYLTPRRGDTLDPNERMTGESSGSFGFALSEVTLFNRREWARTQQQVPDPNGNMIPNPTYEPGYIPTYYALNDTSDLGIFVNKRVGFDPNTQTWVGKETATSWKQVGTVYPNGSFPASAVISTLSPTSSWLSEETLKRLWIEDENQRTQGEPFRIDSLLYTNHSIFSMARRRSKHKGKTVLNGGLVASDLGILSAGGLELNYDERVTQFLGILDYTASTLLPLATHATRYRSN